MFRVHAARASSLTRSKKAAGTTGTLPVGLATSTALGVLDVHQNNLTDLPSEWVLGFAGATNTTFQQIHIEENSLAVHSRPCRKMNTNLVCRYVWVLGAVVGTNAPPLLTALEGHRSYTGVRRLI